MVWQIRQLHVKIAEAISYLLKMSRHFIRKKDLRMNLRDALLAENKENSKKIEDRAEIDINRIVILQ